MNAEDKMKPIIKKREIIKKPQTLLKSLSFSLVALVLASSISVGAFNYAQAKSNYLPSKEAVQHNLNVTNVQDTSYLSFVDNIDAKGLNEIKELIWKDNVSRLPINPNGSPTKININIKPTEEQKIIIENFCVQLNKIFSVINPNYKFELNYNADMFDKLNIYNINISEKESPERSFGVETSIPIPTKNGLWSPMSNIVIYNTSYNSKFEATLYHEFAHSLGIGDAYLTNYANNNTIMGAGANNSIYYKSDIALFASLYADLNNPEVLNKVIEFINTYDYNEFFANCDNINVANKIENCSKESIIKQLDYLGYKCDNNWKLDFEFDENLYTYKIVNITKDAKLKSKKNNYEGYNETLYLKQYNKVDKGTINYNHYVITKEKNGNKDAIFGYSTQNLENSIGIVDQYKFNDNGCIVKFGDYLFNIKDVSDNIPEITDVQKIITEAEYNTIIKNAEKFKNCTNQKILNKLVSEGLYETFTNEKNANIILNTTYNEQDSEIVR